MNRMNKTRFLKQDELEKTQVNIDEESYQILSLEELEKLQPRKKGKADLYFCEIDPYDNPYTRKKLGTRREKVGVQWLVAVGPGGMILAEQVFGKWMIDSKAAMGVMTCMDLAQMEVEAAYVEWYTAKPMAKARYQTMRREHPEDIYVTLAELGEERFTKVMGLENTDRHIETVQQSEIRLYYTTDLQEAGDDKIILGSVDAYAGNMGTRYLLNHAFRRANQELKNSDYVEINWQYKEKKTTHDGVAIYIFTKENAKGEFAVLEVTDCR